MAGFFSQVLQKVIPGSASVAVETISAAARTQQTTPGLPAAYRTEEPAASNVITIEEIQIVASPPSDAAEKLDSAPVSSVQVSWHAEEQKLAAAIDAFMNASPSRLRTGEALFREFALAFFAAEEPAEREAPRPRRRARRHKAASKAGTTVAGGGVDCGGSVKPFWYLPGATTRLGEGLVLRALGSQMSISATFSETVDTVAPSPLMVSVETLVAPMFFAAPFRTDSKTLERDAAPAAAMAPASHETPSGVEPPSSRREAAHPRRTAETPDELPAPPAPPLKPNSGRAGVDETPHTSAMPPTFEAGVRRFLAQMILSPGLSAAMRAALPVAPMAFRPASAEGLVPRVFSGRLGDRPVQVHYTPYEGRLVFAGWQEASAEARREQSAGGLWGAALASNFALPTPDPIRNDILRILGFGRPRGEDASRQPVFDGRDASIGERLAMAVTEQLSKGPKSLRDGKILRSLNAQLAGFPGLGTSAKLTKGEWEELLSRALSSAIGCVPVMDRGGVRSLSAIQDDAAKLLGMDVELLYQWEDSFGVDSVAEHLFGSEPGAPKSKADKALVAKLSRALQEQMSERALIAMGPPEGDIGIKRPEELDLQWTVARLSMAASAEEKAAAAFELIRSLARTGNVKAGRLLALIARHSVINAIPSKQKGFAPRWTQEELTMLLKALMGSDAWAVSSHRSFRGFLTPAENAAFNSLIHSANFAAAVDVVRAVDVLQVEEQDFWQALDETGRAEVFLDTAIARMGLFKPEYLD